jgi:hypothetical protein
MRLRFTKKDTFSVPLRCKFLSSSPLQIFIFLSFPPPFYLCGLNLSLAQRLFENDSTSLKSKLCELLPTKPIFDRLIFKFALKISYKHSKLMIQSELTQRYFMCLCVSWLATCLATTIILFFKFKIKIKLKYIINFFLWTTAI